MPTVIAPDLSNLPAGETAIDPITGEEFTKESLTPQRRGDFVAGCASTGYSQYPARKLPRTVYSCAWQSRNRRPSRRHRQGPAGRRARTRRQRRHRPGRRRARLQPGRHAGLRGARRRREGAGDVRPRVHPDAAGRLRLQGAVPGHPGLRHHVHLGHKGIRPVDRLDRRLGPGGVGDHRAGQRRRGRRDLPVQVPRPGRTRREPLGQGAARVLLHHLDDAGQRARRRRVRDRCRTS